METVFINRIDELGFLKSELNEARDRPALVLLVSPTGFGKSCLTDQLSVDGTTHPLLTVDPFVRGRDRIPLYKGFFIQKCAEVLSEAAESGSADWQTFEAYLSRRRWTTFREKRISDALQEAPSRGSLYKAGLDYASRLFGFGRFAVEQLIGSDDGTAVRLCEEYVEHVLAGNEVRLVLREAQHVDGYSLKSLLRCNGSYRSAHLVFEYTSDDGGMRVLPEHQKAFLRAAETNPNYRIKQLRPLSPEALQDFIGAYLDPDYVLSPSTYGKWSGNLNELLERRHWDLRQAAISSFDPVVHVLENPTAAIEDRISKLPELERYLLAVVYANVEAVDPWSMSQAVASAYRQTPQTRIDHAVARLIEEQGLLRMADRALRFTNETIADAVGGTPVFRTAIVVAEAALRDHYGRLVEMGSYGAVGGAVAVRHFFRLSGRTRDTVALMQATKALTEEVRRSSDQSIYIDIIRDAIAANPDLASADRRHLGEWAADVAYDVGEWERCVGILQTVGSADVRSRTMLACALQEVGEHDSSLAIAASIARDAVTADERVAATLVKVLVTGCCGDHAGARGMLEWVLADPASAASALSGYAHRFFEIIGDYPEVLVHLRLSMDCFERAGLHVSKAYSQLAASVLLARTGDINGARAWISQSESTLAGSMHARHIVLNNGAAVELLGDQPDFGQCRDRLETALRSSRDDFSDLTILTNLGIAYCGCGRIGEAVDCAEKVLTVLGNHDFADRDIYWPACFNASVILRRADRPKAASDALAFPTRHGGKLAVNSNYWRFRYHGSEPAASYAFLASREFHPLYLSNWLIDREGLEILKSGSPR